MIAACYGDGRDGSRQPVVIFLGADAVRELCRNIPQLRSRYLARFGALPRLLFWAAVAALIVAMAVYSLPRLAAGSVSLVPMEWEQALGRIAVRGLATQRCPGEEGQQALAGLATRLSAAAEPGFPLQIQVARNPGQNAFAAPGGQIVILSGLIDAANTSEEVAGVLAHEIAHVTERHPMAGILRAASLSLVLGAILGDVTALGTLAGTLGEHLANLSYSRSDEATADAIAVDMLNQADIRGEDFAAFFDHLDGNGSEGLESYFSSHPSPDSRADAVARASRGRGDAMDERQWRALQIICDH